MFATLRLVNLAVVVLVVVATLRGEAGRDAAFESGRFTGAALLCLVPLLTLMALRRQASRGVRRAAVVYAASVMVLVLLVALAGWLSAQRWSPALLGAALISLLCVANMWGVRAFARERPDDPQTRGWFAARHWRGALPLAQTFWFGGMLVLLLQFVQMGVFGMLADRLPLRTGAWLVLGMVGSSVALLAWQCVGVWRSANREARAGRAAWPALARLAVVAAVLSTVHLGARFFWTPLREHALIASGRDPLPPLEARVTTDDAVLLLHGTFGAGSADRVRRMMASAPAIRTVALSSPGGRLREATQIAELVRRRGLDTYVDTRCESACTFVFLAGKDRAATPNARIGFHRPTFAGFTAMGFDAATEGMLGTYREAGIPAAFLERVASTSPDHMWYPSPRELADAGVINRVSLGGETSALGFLVVGSKQELAAALRAVPMMVAMDRHFPGTIDAAVQAAWMERTQGGIDSAVGAAARTVIGERYPRILAAADDASLDSFARIMVDQMKAARAVSAEACAQLLEGRLNIAQVLPPPLVRREQDWALDVLAADRLVERGTVDRGDFQHAMAEVRSALPPESLAVIDASDELAEQAGRRCEATIALYERILGMADARRHLLLRGLFQGGVD